MKEYFMDSQKLRTHIIYTHEHMFSGTAWKNMKICETAGEISASTA